ncbi:MAG TPA: ZIP family metal transporter [archaeon]|nr:ZIP family metal transporter [archaeon]
MLELVYASGVAIIILAAGLFAFSHRGKSDIRYWIALASGVLISTALFEMLPEIGGNFLFVAVGFFSLYLMEKLFMIHACGEYECKIHETSWAAMLSTGIDNFIDGMAIATATVASPFLGLIVTAAVAIHESVQSVTISMMMKKRYFTPRKILFTLLIFTISIPLGALLFRTFLASYFEVMLAFAAGVFLYVGASDMLPESHKQFNIKVVASVISGALLIPLLGLLG